MYEQHELAYASCVSLPFACIRYLHIVPGLLEGTLGSRDILQIRAALNFEPPGCISRSGLILLFPPASLALLPAPDISRFSQPSVTRKYKNSSQGDNAIINGANEKQHTFHGPLI